ncbi:MAG: nucleoside 2-deoxyribosyltransferase [Pseudomonadota bacterium]
MSRSQLFSTVLFAVLIATSATAKDNLSESTPTYYVYLAGPEVFLPKPVEAGEKKKALISELNEKHEWPFKLVGLYPMDNEIEDFALDFKTGIKIYDANIDLMDKAHYIAANMIRFRGPSMDVGTAFEMGYMRGAGKPVFAYYDAEPFYGQAESPGLYPDRVRSLYEIDPEDPNKDVHGQSIESFEMADNLMMIGALESGNAKIEATFSDVIEAIAEHIIASNVIELEKVAVAQ